MYSIVQTINSQILNLKVASNFLNKPVPKFYRPSFRENKPKNGLLKSFRNSGSEVSAFHLLVQSLQTTRKGPERLFAVNQKWKRGEGSPHNQTLNKFCSTTFQRRQITLHSCQHFALHSTLFAAVSMIFVRYLLVRDAHHVPHVPMPAIWTLIGMPAI
jgi:hypothetical protein